MALHSSNIFLVFNFISIKVLIKSSASTFDISSSLDKILLEDRCCFCFILSAMSNKDLQNRNLFPSSPLLPSMKIFPLSNKCFFWNYWLSATLSLSTLNSRFYLPSSLLYRIVYLTPQMLQGKLNYRIQFSMFENFLCAYFR